MLSPDLTALLSLALLLYVGWFNKAGRNRWMSRLLVLLLLSPGLRYLSALFMFPIRLQLSAWACWLLQKAGLNVVAEGNVLIKNNLEMTVDPACMGLQLTGVSLLMALFALIWQENQWQKAVPLRWVIAYGCMTFGFTVLCNLFRIMLLVTFEVMPGTWSHEGIGLVCVAVYAWLPAWRLAGWVVRTIGQTEKSFAPVKTVQSISWGLGLLAIGLGVMAFTTRPAKPGIDASQPARYSALIGSAYHADLTYQPLENGVVKLSKPGLLVYLKPQFDWFSADHNPMVCWRGSGYDLRRVHETLINSHPAYVGELHKKGRILYTAWWFSNGSVNTISQLTMRSRMLQGETGFVLVNVTMDKQPD